MDRMLHVHVRRCLGCGKCELACAFGHGDSGAPGVPRIQVLRRGPEAGTPVTCLQCHDAACVAVCPTGALARHPGTGAITLQDERCVHCRACVLACPFGNMVWDPAAARVAKCDLCGGAPRCAAFCPNGALVYARAPAAGAAP
ncbi:MAG TPA: 4Fe-4S dicluster domain-containing protein [Polyangia bacterium]|jgi:Fe-S-cluster-containing hydrogenase component 2